MVSVQSLSDVGFIIDIHARSADTAETRAACFFTADQAGTSPQKAASSFSEQSRHSMERNLSGVRPGSE
jgi:hypothetical protein